MKPTNLTPLKSSFMLAAMIGLIVSIVYTSFGTLNPTWGVTLIVVFAAMLIAAFISMTRAPVDEQLDILHPANVTIRTGTAKKLKKKKTAKKPSKKSAKKKPAKKKKAVKKKSAKKKAVKKTRKKKKK